MSLSLSRSLCVRLCQAHTRAAHAKPARLNRRLFFLSVPLFSAVSPPSEPFSRRPTPPLPFTLAGANVLQLSSPLPLLSFSLSPLLSVCFLSVCFLLSESIPVRMTITEEFYRSRCSLLIKVFSICTSGALARLIARSLSPSFLLTALSFSLSFVFRRLFASIRVCDGQPSRINKKIKHHIGNIIY